MAALDSHEEDRSLSRIEWWMKRRACLRLKVRNCLSRVPSRSSDKTKSLTHTEACQPPALGSSGLSDSDPSEIGRYRIIRRLGQGGFGRVYLAHDDDLDRPVAVKVPNPERIRQPDDVEAYFIEARFWPNWTIPTSCRSSMWVARRTDSVSSSRSLSKAATWRSG